MRHPHWTRILDVALDRSGSQADPTAIDLVERTLHTFERFGFKSWVEHLRRSWTRNAIRAALIRRAKDRSRVLVSYNDELISKDTRRGIRIENEEGRESWQQTLFSEMSWAEFDQWRRLNQDQITALTINEVIADKILQLREQVPDSAGPRDAARALGIDLGEWLAS